ncbi:MAG TPA: hydantoinase/oxoprolinase family protein [Thermomicrobiales bacterium]|nr:hydantoinase/oxoprolinase family protein [Thermomicrobiales bacterium]
MLRIGIDVGGTNTDAALMQGSTVHATCKTPTTPDITTGIVSAVSTILVSGRVAAENISSVMIGTTHFTNAVIERRHLAPTAVVRLALPAAESIPPMMDWPTDIRDAVGNTAFMVHGGNEFDGREIHPLVPEELEAVASAIRDAGITDIAISAAFAPVRPAMEDRAAAILGELLPHASITTSHEVGQLGLLERENAAILNAALRPLARKTVAAFREAITGMGMTAPLYLTQNDGTLMTADFAERFPVLTFASGPSNSVRGAAFLSGRKNALVLDVGGTTSDLGVLVDGFPRRSSLAVDVGGVRTNFRMPDVYSFGLGGGSIVTCERDEAQVGPRSVGYRITEKARVFGGETLTATDIAVASGWTDLGDRSRVTDLDPCLLQVAQRRIREMVSAGVDRMKTQAGEVDLIVVGGGSILVTEVNGVGDLIRPAHHDAANAVGAAIAQISGEVDRVFALDEMTRDEAVTVAKREATERAVTAGADPATIEIVDVEDIPLAYLPSNATRIRAKAVGDVRE